ncbi:hypothetical protein K469DRAFT_714072 [Zopfia rhizophila CBS 207.26]|uniref:Uncharacterized protein n=1 Tax=Zopfia rhizophila CBS 207.26 TaxID=1314779 RepID=A0A6A6DN16_9PEZI|nr:hypothetical protein K469DRAFT_714072 [Zopfia rhizophila CBS 207.26]
MLGGIETLSLRTATIEVTIVPHDGDIRFATSTEIRDFFPVIVRTRDRQFEPVYGGSLKPGWNELLYDRRIRRLSVKTGNYTVGVEAKLNDGRVLFSFAADIWLDGLN